MRQEKRFRRKSCSMYLHKRPKKWKLCPRATNGMEKVVSNLHFSTSFSSHDDRFLLPPRLAKNIDFFTVALFASEKYFHAIRVFCFLLLLPFLLSLFPIHQNTDETFRQPDQSTLGKMNQSDKRVGGALTRGCLTFWICGYVFDKKQFHMGTIKKEEMCLLIIARRIKLCLLPH